MREKAKILLVDDQPDFLEPIAFLLKSNGYEVLLANNGAAALEIITTNKPQIVCMDIVMPEMDGLETLAKIREMDKDLPVIMLTGHPDEENQAKARSLGITEFFPKRGNVWQLPTIIEKTLKKPKSSPSDQSNKEK
ncbi:MAG: response regulator [Candidatus Omnitrophica bacterium]|nr:response regulator [Candidatus Omnitrophota bacterium]